MSKLYGSLDNRLLEGRNYNEDKMIHEGDNITMYYYSDRQCYYVTKVVDQRHVFVREYEVVADPSAGPMSNKWLYTKSNDKHEQEWALRNGKWKSVSRWDKDSINEFRQKVSWFRYPGDFTDKDIEKVESGKEVVKYHKLQPISFGVLDYYWDYEF